MKIDQEFSRTFSKAMDQARHEMVAILETARSAGMAWSEEDQAFLGLLTGVTTPEERAAFFAHPERFPDGAAR